MKTTLQFKLSAIIVALVVGVVGLLAGVLITTHVRDLEASLSKKAKTYAELVARDVNSAVAFEDRQTAREVFEAISVDSDVIGLALYSASGALLESRGELDGAPLRQVSPPSLVMTRRKGVMQVLTPVVSREGPRGALILDLSTATAAAGQLHVVYLTMGWGLGAIALGLLAALFIARSVTRRLSALARAAAAVTNGDLVGQRPVVDNSRDEIGSLVASFNAMWSRLKSLLDDIQQTARQEATRLDELVQRRTAELNHRNAEMQLVLDHVEQGLVTVDIDGRVGRERSRVVDSWFGPPPEGVTLWDWLMKSNPEQREWFGAGWSQLQDGVLELAVAAEQLPTSLQAGGCCYGLSFRPLMSGDTFLRMLVVITDRSMLREKERAEAERRELSEIVERFQRDRGAVAEFFSVSRSLVEEVSSETDEILRTRALHTLKGNCGMMGLQGIAQTCHELETALLEGRETGTGAGKLLKVEWNQVEMRLAMFTGSESDRFEADVEDYQALLAAIDGRGEQAELKNAALRIRYERVESRLHRLAEHATELADRLGKGPVRIRVEADDVRIPPNTFSKFWSASQHVIRNAVDHGLQDASNRTGLDDPNAIDLLLGCRADDHGFEIEIRDFGRGIDWEKLKRSAEEKGHLVADRKDLVDVLFIDGVTTRDLVSEVSGRGVGLAAARAACEQLGGAVRVTSETGMGTSIVFRFLKDPSSTSLPQPQFPPRQGKRTGATEAGPDLRTSGPW